MAFTIWDCELQNQNQSHYCDHFLLNFLRYLSVEQNSKTMEKRRCKLGQRVSYTKVDVK